MHATSFRFTGCHNSDWWWTLGCGKPVLGAAPVISPPPPPARPRHGIQFQDGAVRTSASVSAPAAPQAPPDKASVAVAAVETFRFQNLLPPRSRKAGICLQSPQAAEGWAASTPHAAWPRLTALCRPDRSAQQRPERVSSRKLDGDQTGVLWKGSNNFGAPGSAAGSWGNAMYTGTGGAASLNSRAAAAPGVQTRRRGT